MAKLDVTPLGPQVLILPDFKDFPGTELTLEFWMWSADNCRQGTPFSYAHGSYAQQDNSFLLFNYNDWCVGLCKLVPSFMTCAVMHNAKSCRLFTHG